jgi:hypothetical protein
MSLLSSRPDVWSLSTCLIPLLMVRALLLVLCTLSNARPVSHDRSYALRHLSWSLYRMANSHRKVDWYGRNSLISIAIATICGVI